ncbi:MAG TPA: MBL fold metallo-hydrolase [Candidatus Methylomirabilis sp.]|nr:MBL fold metallo-hydrolase [Candidatus Methylomirabilis sp.]
MKVHAFTVGPLESNSYLVVDEATREAALVDPGMESEPIADLLTRERLTVTAIINTHGHFDHVFGNAYFKAKAGAPLLMHRADLELVKRLEEQSLYFGFRATPSPSPDRFLEEGDEVRVGEIRLRVLHTPGHSPGGICLVTEGAAFVGDTLFAGSIGRTDLPGGSAEELLTSIREKLLVLPDETVLYPGHGPATTIGHERRHNPFLTGRVPLFDL